MEQLRKGREGRGGECVWIQTMGRWSKLNGITQSVGKGEVITTHYGPTSPRV